MTWGADELTWRDGATIEGVPAPRGKLSQPKPELGAVRLDAVCSVTGLVAAKAATGDLKSFKDRVGALPTLDTATLITRVSLADDALMLWAIHLVLGKRGVAPALRWPPNVTSPQTEFVTFAADVHWFSKRNPDHRPRFRGWAKVLQYSPASAPWHSAVHYQYQFIAARRSLAYLAARGLALTQKNRQELMTLPTNAMQAERRWLNAGRLEELRAHLLTHAMDNPDRSGMRQPCEVAARRTALWRTYLLSGKSKTMMAHNWHVLTGQATGEKRKPLSRQSLDRQLAIIEDVLRQIR